MSYYNTIHETGREVKESHEKALKQDDIILKVFYLYPDQFYTPFDIQSILIDSYNKDYPITSIRRSINTLTNKDSLIKTSAKKQGLYGKNNYCWRYNKGEGNARK